MPRGLKVFDVYGEVHLDKDELRDAVRGLPGELGPDADRAGQSLGKRMSEGLARSVEAGSARLTKARRAEQNATDAVKLAEVRLSEAREKGGQKASTLLALEQRLEQAHRRLADAQSNTVTSTKKLEDAQRRLASSMGDNLDKNLGPRMRKSGDDAGGKLALGMRMSVIRNSPLIVAAIGAGLAAGGPLMMTAATALFAGVGIVAAAQSQKVQSAWLGTWHQVRDGAVSDAKVIEPVLVRMAGRVGGAFERMRPQIRGAFTDAAPQIEVFTSGIINLAQNALPGLVRSVERGMPVTQGFAAFLAKTGTGLSDFFDRITTHGPAAGQVWSQLGTSMETLLPTLGELIGQGAELASDVLPLVNSGLGLALRVVSALGPALPAVVAGFSAMKIAQSVGGWIGTMGSSATKTAQNLAFASYSSSAFAGTAGLASRAASGVSGAMGMVSRVAGPLSIAIGLVSVGLEAGHQRMDGWTQALLRGGKAAELARTEMTSKSWVDGGIFATGSFEWLQQIAGWFGQGEKAAASSREEYKRLVAAMSPLEQANLRVTQAQNHLNDVTDKYGPKSDEAAVASGALKKAQGELERQNADLELAIHGVTQAMIDQANQAMGSIDADFAYQDSLDALEEKQKALAVAIRDHGRASEEARDAQRDLAEGIWDTAKKAAAAAPELDGLTQGTAEYDRMVQNLTLRSLVELRKGLGPEMAAVVDGMIAKVKAGGASLDEIGKKKPKPVVDADTKPLITKAQAADQILTALNGRKPLPGLDLATGPFNGKTQTSFNLLDLLAGKRPTPVAGLNTATLNSRYASSIGALTALGNRRPTPVAGLLDRASPGLRYIQGLIGGVQSKTVTITTRHVDIGVSGRGTAGQASGGNVGKAVRGFDSGGSPARHSDGRISGPGGMFDDMVPAVTSTGEPLRVSNTEWIINGPVSQAQGESKMAALNAGRADIVVRQPAAPRFAAGGTSEGMTAAGKTPPGMVIHMEAGAIAVHFAGTYDLASSADLRKAAKVFEGELIKLLRARN